MLTCILAYVWFIDVRHTRSEIHPSQVHLKKLKFILFHDQLIQKNSICWVNIVDSTFWNGRFQLISTQSSSGYRIDNRIQVGQSCSDDTSSTNRPLWYLTVLNGPSRLMWFSMNFESKYWDSGTKSHELLEIIWFGNLL